MLSRRSRGGAVRTMVEGLMAVYSTAGSVTTRCPALTRRGASLVVGASCRASWQTATMVRGCRLVDVRGHGEQGCHEPARRHGRGFGCLQVPLLRFPLRSCGLAGWAARLACLTNSGGLGPRSARNRSLAPVHGGVKAACFRSRGCFCCNCWAARRVDNVSVVIVRPCALARAALGRRLACAVRRLA